MPPEPPSLRITDALAFLEPGLVPIGSEAAIKSSIDAQMTAQSITSNDDMMELVSDIERGNNAWAVGRFDAIAEPGAAARADRKQIPAVKTFAVMAHIDGGVTGTLRAEARDDQAAENLRQVVQGFLALGRLQARTTPRLRRCCSPSSFRAPARPSPSRLRFPPKSRHDPKAQAQGRQQRGSGRTRALARGTADPPRLRSRPATAVRMKIRGLREWPEPDRSPVGFLCVRPRQHASAPLRPGSPRVPFAPRVAISSSSTAR